MGVLRRLEPVDGSAPPSQGWPGSVPAVAQVLREGLDLHPGATVLTARTAVPAALPGAALLLDEDGVAPRRWEELEVVAHWRAFLDGPGRYLRPLLQG